MRILASSIAVLLLTTVAGAFAQQIPSASATEAVARSQAALREHDFKGALAFVREAMRNFPDETSLQVQLARVYIYQRQDRRAAEVLDVILRKDPSNRAAKIELAQLLGYRGDYNKSDQLYRELLSVNADDEAASIGLVRNLIHAGRSDQARREVQRALERHPNSTELFEYSEYLAKSGKSADEVRGASINRMQVGESYFADNVGNRSLRSSQALQYQVNHFVSSYVQLEERSLWKTGTARVNVLSVTDDFQLRINKFLSVVAGGGAVRFTDAKSGSLYVGDLELRPWKSLLLSAGYSRFPISPTFDSAQFGLLGEGWHSRLDWRSKNFSLGGDFSQSHYSDGNRAERERGEAMRWFGGTSFAFGTGYSFSHLRFTQNFDHGYFSPSQYRSHLAEAGLRFRIGRVFRAEYLGLGGIESFAGGASNPAGEVVLRHQILLGRWDVGLSYSRFQVAQSTSAFQANSASVTLGRRF